MHHFLPSFSIVSSVLLHCFNWRNNFFRFTLTPHQQTTTQQQGQDNWARKWGMRYILLEAIIICNLLRVITIENITKKNARKIPWSKKIDYPSKLFESTLVNGWYYRPFNWSPNKKGLTKRTLLKRAKYTNSM